MNSNMENNLVVSRGEVNGGMGEIDKGIDRTFILMSTEKHIEWLDYDIVYLKLIEDCILIILE